MRTPRHPELPTRLRIVVLGTVFALVGVACGGGSSAGAGGQDDGGEVLEGSIVDQDDIFIDEDELPAVTSPLPPADDGGGGATEGGEGDDADPAEGPEAPDDTIPQNEEEEGSEVTNLFSALRIFTDCLSDEGQSFIGIPDPSAEPDDPVNDAGYLAALGKCAALSNIQQALASFTETSDNLDPEEIQDRNEGLVIWADCMEGRGWTIGALEPDSKGLLSPGDLTPPDGESLLESDDLQECASDALAQAGDDDEESDDG